MMSSRLHILSMTAAGLALVTLAGTQVWLSHLRYEQSVESNRVQKEKQALLEEQQRLRLELSNLTRPERLRKIAQNELGMRPPAPMQVIRP